MANTTQDARQKFEANEKLRLKTYLEQVKTRVAGTTGEMQKFWQREEKRTQRKLDSYV